MRARPMKAKTTHSKKRQIHTSRRNKTLEEQYNNYFRPAPTVPDNGDLSLEQPSPFKIFPTETTYVISDCMFA
jgi:hypothetical protein